MNTFLCKERLHIIDLSVYNIFHGFNSQTETTVRDVNAENDLGFTLIWETSIKI